MRLPGRHPSSPEALTRAVRQALRGVDPRHMTVADVLAQESLTITPSPQTPRIMMSSRLDDLETVLTVSWFGARETEFLGLEPGNPVLAWPIEKFLWVAVADCRRGAIDTDASYFATERSAVQWVARVEQDYGLDLTRSELQSLLRERKEFFANSFVNSPDPNMVDDFIMKSARATPIPMKKGPLRYATAAEIAGAGWTRRDLVAFISACGRGPYAVQEELTEKRLATIPVLGRQVPISLGCSPQPIEAFNGIVWSLEFQWGGVQERRPDSGEPPAFRPRQIPDLCALTRRLGLTLDGQHPESGAFFTRTWPLWISTAGPKSRQEPDRANVMLARLSPREAAERFQEPEGPGDRYLNVDILENVAEALWSAKERQAVIAALGAVPESFFPLVFSSHQSPKSAVIRFCFGVGNLVYLTQRLYGIPRDRTLAAKYPEWLFSLGRLPTPEECRRLIARVEKDCRRPSSQEMLDTR